MMNTPEKTQISSSLSKFEDSPVFNYINSLSPIKPVKSVHVTQTFNPLSFASLPSIFTSPHVSSHKESRFLKCSTDPSKPELSSADGTKVSPVEDAGVDVHENFDPAVSLGEVSFELPNEPSRIAIELPQTLKYDCGSPDCAPTPCVIEMNCVSQPTCTSLAIVPFVQEASQKGLSDGVEVAATFQIERKKETIGSEWESLISETADLLIFSSPNDSEAFRGVILKSLDPGSTICSTLISQFPQDDISDYKDQTEGITGLSEINSVNESFEDNNVTNIVPGSLTDHMENRMSAPYSIEPGSNLHRGFRRRCLDFEMLAARRKNLDGGSNTNSSVDNKLKPSKAGCDSSRCIVPGIGLHLNALAIASRDNNNSKLETSSSGTQKLILPCTTTSNSPTADNETAHESLLASVSTKRETDDVENGVQLAEDASQASAYLVNEEFNQNSPKKKRRRLEQAGESEACKRCNCKKSKCLKLYCECFAAGVYCIEPCSCQDCFNKPIHEDTVLATRKQIESRNPLAFAPKVIRTSDPIPEVGDDLITTPASARHKRGCNCKKSNCLKKYCECFQGGVGCSINCRCEGCKNAFGRKEGSAILEAEGDPGEETDPSEKNAANKKFEETDILNNEEQNPAALPTTPLQLCRPLVQLPFSSKGKPPRSFIAIGSSSALYTGHIYGKPNIIQPPNIIEKHFQSVAEDETLEILQGNSSPGTSIKTSSPNSKRISPPQCELGSTLGGGRSGRKLILQSIPSFPSLTPKH
ncbi:golgin subfamily B member 1-like isoform X1 [Hibiscus syriacus]|uniref:Golgin subfamily B member 1-like isoform X1 n=1 Tax=Hibiscus syriacus TaxID=106335 RepID=A0A6A3AE90_HIBSY|nr:protein tesmin/TSO1-like CXC 2 isoform X1 [Hibiscus syriacus]KAE8702884.1 golgin subfamily B member 1-like isoform X1 [Hibiscus syriacus]